MREGYRGRQIMWRLRLNHMRSAGHYLLDDPIYDPRRQTAKIPGDAEAVWVVPGSGGEGVTLVVPLPRRTVRSVYHTCKILCLFTEGDLSGPDDQDLRARSW